MNFVIFHLALKDQSWTCRPLKKGLTKADVICMKYTMQNRTIFYLAAIWPPFFRIRRYHIEKHNEISGSMTLTVGAIIEFANETRDDIPCHRLSGTVIKKASYSGPPRLGEKHAVSRLRQTKPLWNGEHNRYVCRTGKRNGWKKLNAD